MNILEIIYNNVTAPILEIISKIPEIVGKFILFIVFITIGYVLGRITYFFVKFILKNIINLDEILEKYELKQAYYGYSLNFILSNLAKWYVYIYFLILGLEISGVSIKNIVLTFLSNLYIAIGIFLFGLIVAQIAYNIIYKSNIKEKELLSDIAKYVLVYIFFVLSLDYIGIKIEIFLDLLRYFALAASISLGIFLAVIVLIRYKEEIEKILK